MRLVATMMVRDEVDIVSAMIEHHVAQGVDHLIVTDNASVDGTREVLEEYEAAGVLELHHDPVHRKQQHSVVTGMARRARTHFAADWVINADADEFFVPVDRSRTLADVFAEIPLALSAFTAEVTNLVGPPAEEGGGISRLLWRDHRSEEQLQSIGIHAQPTPNAIHRGHPGVTVAQGNHFVSLVSQGQPSPDLAVETLHLPWRSWSQLERKVLNAGRGYEANPDLKPSRNHHGMADYRRYRAGRLRYAYLLRTPRLAELEQSGGAFQRDSWLAEHLQRLTRSAVLPHRLAEVLTDPEGSDISPAEHEWGARLGQQFHDLETESRQLRLTVDEHRRHVHRLTGQVRNLRRDLRAAKALTASGEES